MAPFSGGPSGLVHSASDHAKDIITMSAVRAALSQSLNDKKVRTKEIASFPQIRIGSDVQLGFFQAFQRFQDTEQE